MDTTLYQKETCTIQDLQMHDNQIVEMLKQIQVSIQQQYSKTLEYQNILMISGQLTDQMQQMIMQKLIYYRNFNISVENLLNDYAQINYDSNLALLHYQEETLKNKIHKIVSQYTI